MAFDKIRESLFNAVQKSKGDISLLKDQGMEESRLCEYVKGKIEDVRAFPSRISHEGQWLTNIAYLLGFDSVFYDTNVKQFRPLPTAPGYMRTSKVSVNRILPSFQNRAARLTKNPPRYDVRPKSTSEEDRDAARLAMYVITQIWDVQSVNMKRLELVNWVQQCGHAYLKSCWDKTLGPRAPYRHHITNQEILIPLGDVRVDVVNPFEVFPDPLAKSFEELGWLVQARIRPLHYFRDQYGDKGYLVKPEDTWLTSLQYEYRINSYNASSGMPANSNSLLKESAIEISLYEKPSYKFPEGRQIVCANGVLLKNDDLPINELGWSKFDDVMVAGKYYPESVITHARPIQDQLNRTISQRASWINKTLTGKYLVAKNAGLSKEAFNDQSGEIIEYTPQPNAPEPKALQVPVIPQYAYLEDEKLMSMMDNIFGLSEPAQGELPAAGMPAIGLQYLVEQDMTRIGVVTEQHEHAYAATGRHILKYVEGYYEVPRILKMTGKGMEYTVKEFVGADIRGNNDVIVVKGSTLPSSKVLKRQEVINLHQGGYLGNPTDPKVVENVLNMLEYGDVQEAWKDHSLDMGQIKRHIQMIEQGQKPPVSEFDNHPLFIQELNRYRKSDKFESLPPQARATLIQVMEEHVQEMMNIVGPANDADPNLQDHNEAQAMEAEIQAQEGVPPGTNPEELLPQMNEAEIAAAGLNDQEAI